MTTTTRMRTRTQVILSGIIGLAVIAAYLITTLYLSFDESYSRPARNSVASSLTWALEEAMPGDATSATAVVYDELGKPKYKHNRWELCELTDRTPIRVGISAAGPHVVLVVHNRVDRTFDIIQKGTSTRVYELPDGVEVTWFAGIRARQ